MVFLPRQPRHASHDDRVLGDPELRAHPRVGRARCEMTDVDGSPELDQSIVEHDPFLHELRELRFDLHPRDEEDGVGRREERDVFVRHLDRKRAGPREHENRTALRQAQRAIRGQVVAASGGERHTRRRPRDATRQRGSSGILAEIRDLDDFAEIRSRPCGELAALLARNHELVAIGGECRDDAIHVLLLAAPDLIGHGVENAHRRHPSAIAGDDPAHALE